MAILLKATVKPKPQAFGIMVTTRTKPVSAAQHLCLTHTVKIQAE